MARVFTGVLSYLSVVILATAVMANCQDCQTCETVQACSSCGCSWNRPFTEESSPDVFYNFYVPGAYGGSPAAALPAPYPTPALVGHQYTTYQPFMPNEWLYKHHRTYHQHYNQGMGLNRTMVHWHGTPVRTHLWKIRKAISLPR